MVADRGALLLGNWPWRVTEEQFEEFFDGYNMVPGSVKFHMNEEGRRSGKAACVFATEADAERAAKEKNRTDLGGRNIFCDDLDLAEWEDFENWDPAGKNVRCGDSLNEENVERCVKLRGLPRACSKGEVIAFFDGFTLRKKDVTIDIEAGRPTGYAIVELQNEDEAARACEELDHKEIGTRWIGVSPAEMRRRREEAAY